MGRSTIMVLDYHHARDDINIVGRKASLVFPLSLACDGRHKGLVWGSTLIAMALETN